MKNTLKITPVMLTIFLCWGSALAQPDEDAPIEAVEVSAKAVPVSAKLTLDSLRFGTGIEARQLQGIHTVFTAEGQTVVALAVIKNRGAPTPVDMVWHRNGTEVWRVSLRVGRSKGWRTWSRFKLRPGREGPWNVSIVGPNAKVLGTAGFLVQPPKE